MGLTDYSSLEKEINDAPAPKVLPKGSEVKARVIGINSGNSDKPGRNGCLWYMPRFDVPDDPMVIEFSTFFWDLIDAKSKIDPKDVEKNKYNFQQFVKAFRLDISKPFDWDDFVGSTGYIQVGIQHDDQYGDKNTVSKFVTGPGSSPTKGRPVSDDDIPY